MGFICFPSGGSECQLTEQDQMDNFPTLLFLVFSFLILATLELHVLNQTCALKARDTTHGSWCTDTTK